MEQEAKLDLVFWSLRLGIGATAFLAGADKFTNLLTNWEKYIAPEANKKIPFSKKNFMRTIGVVEMLVGLGILSPRTKVSSYAAAGWLLAIAGNLWLNKDYDVAVRDINMALGAFALGELTTVREKNKAAEKKLAPYPRAA